MSRTLTRDEQRELELRIRTAIDSLEPAIRRYGLGAVLAEAQDACRARPLEGAGTAEMAAARLIRDGARIAAHREREAAR